jgi:rhodanese-related sulfurtransferase
MEPRIDCDELLFRLGDDEILVIDCRPQMQWESVPVHIPGALRMELEILAQDVDTLPDDELIVVVGFDGESPEVRQAFRTLSLRGRHAVCLTGGLKAWVSEGFPIERHRPRIPRDAPRDAPMQSV